MYTDSLRKIISRRSFAGLPGARLQSPPAAESAAASAEQILARLRPPLDPQKPKALFVGRFIAEHRRLIEEGLRRVGQYRSSPPACRTAMQAFAAVLGGEPAHEAGLREYAGRFGVVQLPNITKVFWP